MFPVYSQSRSPNAHGRARLFPVFRLLTFGFYVRMAAPGSTYKNSNQEQKNSRNLKSNQGFAHGTYREQDMEQSAMAAGTASRAEEPLVTDFGCVRLPFRYTGSYRYRGTYDPFLRRQCPVQQLLDRKFRGKFQAIEKAARVRLPVWDVASSPRDLNLPGLYLEAL